MKNASKAAIVASPLVVYFDWRARLRGQILAERNEQRNAASGMSRPHVKGTFLQALLSFGGAAAIGLTVPFVVLLIGLPLALTLRGLLEAIAWVFGIAIL